MPSKMGQPLLLQFMTLIYVLGVTSSLCPLLGVSILILGLGVDGNLLNSELSLHVGPGCTGSVLWGEKARLP